MGPDDFRRCYCDEFEAICRAWAEMRDSQLREDWERTRMLASITISPHIRKPIPPAKLLPLPWDKKRKPAAGTEQGLTLEERKRLAEEAPRKFG